MSPLIPPIFQSLASERATIAFINHVDYLELEYSQGRVTLINLLNKQGYERPLADAYNYAYQNYLKDSANVDYHHFDLNEKPRSKAKETWRQLFHTIKTAVNEQGFLCARAAPVNSWPWFDPSSRDRFARKRNMGEYMANGPPSSSSVDLLNAGDGSRANTTILRIQTGVTRINCLDCLDRTNMIEYVVGTRALMLMLAELGVSTVPPQREWHEEDYHVTDVRRALGSRGLELYRLMWFQNGNAIAQQYTGTGALNSQFITTGHHHCSHNRFSVASKVMDGFHAMGMSAICVVPGNV